MGHPLAPYILQRVATAVSTHLNQHFNLSMIAYLDDWLIFGTDLPSSDIQQEVRRLGFAISERKLVLQPSSQLVYLGLHINAVTQQLQPTEGCLDHERAHLSHSSRVTP
jgi:hypothetical protein